MSLGPGWELVRRSDTLYAADKPYISVLPTRFGFNAKFTRDAALNRDKTVSIHVDRRSRGLAFEFHTEERDHSYTLGYQSGSTKGAKRGAMYCTAALVFSQHNWVHAVAHLPSRPRKARRFIPERRGMTDILVFQPCPAFEIQIDRGHSESIPYDAYGIYRYVSDEGEIVYIGRGRIKARLAEAQRRKWTFSNVEHAIVADENERTKCEAFWIERFKQENNENPPVFNAISLKADTG